MLVAHVVFTAEQTRLIRQGKMTAVVVPLAVKPRGRLLTFRRRITTLDDDGKVVASRSEQVTTAAYDGDSTPVHLTVQSADEIDVATVTISDARACGHRTRAALIDEWFGAHPRTPRARVIRFAIGDLRDAPRLLSANMARRNYTASPRLAADGEPEALREDQLRALATVARQKDVARQHERLAKLTAQPLSARVAAIEAAGADMRLNLRNELAILRERVERAERALGTKAG